MKRLLLVAFATSIFTVGACASSGSGAKAADESWDKQVAAAEAGMKDLSKNDALWRDTGKFLEEAQKAHKDGDKAAADKLMKKVNDQIKMAGMQAESEKNAKPHY
jgi:hypothetical protein